MSIDSQVEDVFEWRVKHAKPFSPSRTLVKHQPLEPVNEVSELAEADITIALDEFNLDSSRSKNNNANQSAEEKGTGNDVVVPPVRVNEAYTPPSLLSPLGAGLLTASPPQNHFSQLKESVRESLVSRGSIINSRMLKRQFIIELAVRFATLQNLKMLDYNIDSKHLEIGEKLGGGSFGTVCKAKLRGLDVAVKQLNSNSLTPETTLALKIEVEILSKLRHPNIVLFIGISMTPTFAAMVTEWCERGSLLDLLKSPTEKFCTKTFLKVALDVARGMWYLHTSEKLTIIHRDVKSPNILIRMGGIAVVADFGLAVMHERPMSMPAEDDEEFHGNAGTLQWMAPEIIRKEAYGQKVDVYSFGIFLTELLTRRMPFRDKYRGLEFKDSVLERNERPSIPTWATNGKGAASESPKLGELVMECTEMNPKRRPTFSQIIDVLESLYFTLEHNEMRAFEDFDLQRWLEALDSGDLDEVTHASYELAEVIDEIASGKATNLAEKRQSLNLHSKELITSCLCRIGYGKAPKLKEEGAEYEYQDFAVEVVQNLIQVVDYLLENASAALPSTVLQDAPSPSPHPSVKKYQLEALVDMLMGSQDETNPTFLALVRILRNPFLTKGQLLSRVIESKVEERLQRKNSDKTSQTPPPSASPLVSVSDDSTTSFSFQSGESITSAPTPLNRPALTLEDEKLMFSRLKKHGLLPQKYKLQGDKYSSMGQVAMLEMEIRGLEKEIMRRKLQLEEALDILKQVGVMPSTVT